MQRPMLPPPFNFILSIYRLLLLLLSPLLWLCAKLGIGDQDQTAHAQVADFSDWYVTVRAGVTVGATVGVRVGARVGVRVGTRVRVNVQVADFSDWYIEHADALSLTTLTLTLAAHRSPITDHPHSHPHPHPHPHPHAHPHLGTSSMTTHSAICSRSALAATSGSRALSRHSQTSPRASRRSRMGTSRGVRPPTQPSSGRGASCCGFTHGSIRSTSSYAT